ncbi:mitogen-activated protein kinase kinase kinase 7 [Plakobranchus ocellatus]|uniref:Mitogen-activated protein kinase kinase kinase 7 n=1 Tax=Plakobranchus ocellatus TaxID=259542 RepID=A0AAV4B5X7_9GAST|nr:mitogen-activated protein kinase kinase kinase 7 [Plakobranchus ocellatus]
MVVSRKQELPIINIYIKGTRLKQKDQFKYLGSLISSDGRNNSEVASRIAQAKTNFQKMKTVLTNKNISIRTRRRALECYIEPILMYGCEAWTKSKQTQKKLEATEMWFLRRMLRISWTAKKTNDTVLEEAHTTRLLISKIRKRQATFFGHVMRREKLENLVTTGMLEGKRSRGKQREKLIEGLTDWLKAGKSLEAIEATKDRKKWRTMIANAEERRRPRQGQLSAPPSLAASRESLHDPRGSRSVTPVLDPGGSKRFSADLSGKPDGELDNQYQQGPVVPQPLHRERGHRRSGSQGTTPAYIVSGPPPVTITSSGVNVGSELPAGITTASHYRPQPSPRGPRQSRSGSMGDLLNSAASDLSPPQIIVTPSPPPRSRGGMGHRRIGSDEYVRFSHASTPLSINTSGDAEGMGGNMIRGPAGSSSNFQQRSYSPQRQHNYLTSGVGGSVVGPPPVHHSRTVPLFDRLDALTSGTRNRADGASAASPPTRSVSHQPPGSSKEHIPVSPRSSSLSSDPLLPLMARQGHQAAFANVKHAYINNDAYFSLEPHLQPIPPFPKNKESMDIFEDHCRMAQEYLRMQAEIAVLTQRKHELTKEREKEEERSLKSGPQLKVIEEYTKLTAENESLMSVHKDLKSQIERYKRQDVAAKRSG